MGLQNAVITKISRAEIRTTHVTGLVTDIGIELGKLVYINPREAGRDPVLANRQKLRIHTVLVSCFFVGGFAGALGFKHHGLCEHGAACDRPVAARAAALPEGRRQHLMEPATDAAKRRGSPLRRAGRQRRTAVRMPRRISIGAGGQPGTATSTGITLADAAAARIALAEDAAVAAAVADRDDQLRARASRRRCAAARSPCCATPAR